jgi:hypothetical protein
VWRDERPWRATTVLEQLDYIRCEPRGSGELVGGRGGEPARSGSFLFSNVVASADACSSQLGEELVAADGPLLVLLFALRDERGHVLVLA